VFEKKVKVNFQQNFLHAHCSLTHTKKRYVSNARVEIYLCLAYQFPLPGQMAEELSRA